jgi:hypothetical protein
MTINEELKRNPVPRPPYAMAKRGFVVLFAACVAFDTFPNTFDRIRPVKNGFNSALGGLGLSQGDWPLFAPNPVLNNGRIVAEVYDSANHRATWSSPDWARCTAWEKFYRFRSMNYFQRVGRNQKACSDLADYLQHAIPIQEQAIPSIRWSETNEILPPAQPVAPMVSIKLDRYWQRMMLSEEAPTPKQSETVWSQQSDFLIKRTYSP